MSNEQNNVNEPKKRGFAAMSSERVRELARQGGIAAHQKGTAHKWTAEEAREAGKKGGAASFQNREEFLRMSSRGGKTASANRKARKEAEKNASTAPASTEPQPSNAEKAE